jgi:hypothetical protein
MKNRFYAFLIHLLLSGLLVAGVAITLVFFVWYPDPLDQAIGVSDIFLLILAVSITMGPMMTFVVYKKGKPGLKFDLFVIVLIQVAALTYGMLTVFEGRPAFIVFNQDRFDAVRWIDLDAKSVKTAELAGNQSAQASWLSPRWVAAIESTDRKRAEEILFSAVDGGADWPQLPELFVPLEQVKETMLKKAQPLSALAHLDKNAPALANLPLDRIKFLPLRSKTKDMAVLIDSESAAVIKIIDIDPWS